MSYARILHILQRHVDRDGTPMRKHIIRFRNAKEFSRFLKQLKQRLPRLAKSASIQPVRIIHAVLCTTSSTPVIPRHKGIAYIESDTRMNVHAFASQSDVPSERIIPWGVRQIKAPSAWRHSTGRAVRIGVIDTGADYSHPNLRYSLARGINLLHRGSPPRDDNGHGTHIAGTIAALTSHNGILGTAPGAIIYPVKAFDQNGSAYVSDIIKGIDWCMRNGIRLINMSFGMKEDSRALKEAVRQAQERGAILIASAGNDGKSNRIDFPASYRETIAVGATDKRHKLARFSNYGKEVFVYAPGNRIYSTWPGNKYATLSGSSMSTSHVTGVVALALALRPSLTSRQIRQLLKSTSTRIRNRKQVGAKEVNALRFIVRCRRV